MDFSTLSVIVQKLFPFRINIEKVALTKMSSFQTSVSDLTGITTPLKNLCKWEFQGRIIYTKEYLGDFDADISAIPIQRDPLCIESATVNDGQYNKSTISSSQSSSLGHRLNGSTCVASSYADTEASMKPNYTASSYKAISHQSPFIPTPTISVVQQGEYNSFSIQNDVVEHGLQSAYFEFPSYTSGPTPINSWYKKPERHEQIAYRLSDPMADPIVQKKMKKPAGQKCAETQVMAHADKTKDRKEWCCFAD
ncbi:hypothetical protein DID88_002485 [Monilinia fructigena]|uniref:Uncharacterized protein n=1 Tax=Monilinia fructigena TaxID=38457 RepID=A0A395IPH3_9HELO|nr:hypothetical protein DID88_002485 [Monilinia fructigena]